MRRQFMATYQNAITLIKQIKNSNDSLNRAIGVDSHATIANRLDTEQPNTQKNIDNAQELIQKLEQSYLDPDTARKIGTAKQQLRIQRDRRIQLLKTASYDEAPKSTPNGPSAHSEPSHSSLDPGRNQSEPSRSTWNRFTHKQSEASTTGDRQEQVQMQVQFQMERKLMHERNHEINIVAQSIMNVHNIMQETGVLVHEQGEQLDIIGQELFTTYRNVNLARENITEANQIQQRARRKYVYLSLIILVLLAVGAVALFV